MEQTPLFWFILAFVIILDVPFFTVIQYLFAREYVRRDRFRLRMAVFVCILVAGSVLANLSYQFLLSGYLLSQIGQVVFELIALFSLFLLYRESWQRIVVLFILTYISIIIPYHAIELVYSCIGINWKSSYDTMGWYILVKAAVDAVFTFALYKVYIKRMQSLINSRGDVWLIVILVYSILITVAMNALREQYVGVYGENIVTVNIFLIAFSILNELFVLFLVYVYTKGKQDAHERAVVSSMWKQDRAKYEISKENVAALNIKSHDLKHFLQMIKSRGAGSRDAEADSAIADDDIAAELERILTTYDADIHTGNDALDVILYENAAFCNSNGITLKCMADGTLLSGMSEPDIYALFENMLSNSIEYLKTVEDRDRRICSLDIHEANNMVLIHQENWFGGSLERKDGEIVTTKSDKQNHGYGLKSMAAIARKYGGSMKVKTEDNLFQVNILLMHPGR